MTRDQLGTCIALEARGYSPVGLPMGEDTPIPGVILFSNAAHTELLMVQGNGSFVDLLEVHRLAEDCIRNWGKDSHLPGFVGDFKRLTPLVVALNGTGAKTSQFNISPSAGD